MADNSPPPQIRRQIFGHPSLRTVRAPEINIGKEHPLEGANRGIGGGGGSAMARGFGAGSERESGDPVLSGDFERNRTLTFLGMPFAGGGLSDRGKEQKAQSEQIQKFLGDYASAVQNGSSQQDAFRSAVQGNGGSAILNQLMMHPTALRSMENLNQFLAQGQPQGPAYTQVKGADGKVYQIARDPGTGQVIGQPEDIGLPGTSPKPTLGNPARDLVKTDKGYGFLQPDGTLKPVTWSNETPGGGGVLTTAGGPSGQAGLPQSGKAAAAPESISDIPGVGQQATDVRKGSYNAQNMRFLRALPQVQQDLSALVQIAPQFAGLGKGALMVKAGQYLGTTQVGEQAAGILNRLTAATPAMAGSNYKAAIENFSKALVDSPNNAPSMIAKNAPIMQANLRNQGQTLADTEALQHGKFPGAIENDLERAGIISSGYQNRAYLEGKGLTGAKWMLDNGFGAQMSTSQLGQIDANWKQMPPSTQQTYGGELQRRFQGQQQQAQQSTATAAANAAQPQPTQPTAAGAWDALPTAETAPTAQSGQSGMATSGQHRSSHSRGSASTRRARASRPDRTHPAGRGSRPRRGSWRNAWPVDAATAASAALRRAEPAGHPRRGDADLEWHSPGRPA